MQIIRYKNKSFTLIQKYSVERMIELCNHRSIDSYRVKYLNPKLSLTELYKVIDNWKNNRIKQFNTTVISCLSEVKALIKKDEYLLYGSTSKKTFISLIDDIKTEEDKKEIDKLVFTTNYLLAKNNNYLDSLISAINEIIPQTPNFDKDKIPLLEKTDTLLNFFISELIDIGFTKSYLIKLIRAIFVFNPSSSFEDCWNNFTVALKQENTSTYVIIFALQGSENQLNNLSNPSLLAEIPTKYIDEPASNTTVNFIKPNKRKRFILYEKNALDTYQSLKLAKNELANVLDVIHLGYSNLSVDLVDKALVVNRETPKKADTLPVFYHIDGYYKSNPIKHSTFVNQLYEIIKSKHISLEVKEKIQSAIRYLRLGNEAIEIEQKFINYWIGLEFIFANYDINTNTFARIKEFLVLTHSVTYVKRNLLQLHQAIKEFHIEDKISNYGDDLSYLTDVKTFDILYSLLEDFPLLAFRANRMKSYLHNKSEDKKKYVELHQQNLEKHLIRIYRIRNELIHEAAQVNNIESITGNLRYYLTFMLNSLIDYFAGIDYSNNIKTEMSINDFFHHQEMVMENMKSNKYELTELLNVIYTSEYLT